MKDKDDIDFKRFLLNHLEWMVFTAGLVGLALMNPNVNNGPSWCMFEMLNVPFCPGDGLGHSIAFVFRGEIGQALESHVFGPFAIVVLVSRIVYLLYVKVFNPKR